MINRYFAMKGLVARSIFPARPEFLEDLVGKIPALARKNLNFNSFSRLMFGCFSRTRANPFSKSLFQQPAKRSACPVAQLLLHCVNRHAFESIRRWPPLGPFRPAGD